MSRPCELSIVNVPILRAFDQQHREHLKITLEISLLQQFLLFDIPWGTSTILTYLKFYLKQNCTGNFTASRISYEIHCFNLIMSAKFLRKMYNLVFLMFTYCDNLTAERPRLQRYYSYIFYFLDYVKWAAFLSDTLGALTEIKANLGLSYRLCTTIRKRSNLLQPYYAVHLSWRDLLKASTNSHIYWTRRIL